MKESRKKRNESLEEKKHAPKVKADQTKVHASETVLCLSFFGVVSVLLSSCRRGVCACVGEKKKKVTCHYVCTSLHSMRAESTLKYQKRSSPRRKKTNVIAQ